VEILVQLGVGLAKLVLLLQQLLSKVLGGGGDLRGKEAPTPYFEGKEKK